MELQNQTFQITGEALATCDPAWTAEALGNVLKNSMEHTPDSGAITVTLSENPIYSQILVEDTGPGIHPEDLPHLFERFYRGKHAAAQSAGIGPGPGQDDHHRPKRHHSGRQSPQGGRLFHHPVLQMKSA